jgi:symplekin
VHQILQKQAERTHQAAREESARLEEQRRLAQESRKRSAPSDEENAAKRMKLEPAAAAGMATLTDMNAFDVSTLPPEMVVDLVVANLGLVTNDELMTAIQVRISLADRG